MNRVSEEDKLSLAKFLEAATISVAMLNAAKPLVQDDGLKRIVDTSLSASEAQIKSVQEFCQSHALTR